MVGPYNTVLENDITVESEPKLNKNMPYLQNSWVCIIHICCPLNIKEQSHRLSSSIIFSALWTVISVLSPL